jgi:PBSX family phage terminase large subunit
MAGDPGTPRRRPYQPFGAARTLFYSRAAEVLLSGPAGTGKSRACLEKLHLCAEKYAGMRGLIVRKTRESLSESGLVTFETKVVPEDHPILLGANRPNRHSYRYPNGSEIIVGGFRQHSLDASQKIMSTDYDLAYVQEAVELTEEEWEKLTTRLRNGVMPYQQLLADTNPDSPGHWLKRRCDAGRTLLLESRHEDNPVLWDARLQAWTAAGANYMAKLDALTGPRYARLRQGRWVQAEGVVYEGWDRQVHLVDAATLQALGVIDRQGHLNRDKIRRVVCGVDWGFTNAGVILVGGLDGDGRLYVVREIYRSKQTIDWWIDEARRLQAEYRPEAFTCDPSEPGYIEQFSRARLRAVPAYNEQRPGIDAVQRRLQRAGDGRPRLLLLSSLSAGGDPLLEEAKKPASTIEEFDSYVWNTTGGCKKGEEPVKENDHGMDALRYLVAYFDLTPKRPFKLYYGGYL